VPRRQIDDGALDLGLLDALEHIGHQVVMATE